MLAGESGTGPPLGGPPCLGGVLGWGRRSLDWGPGAPLVEGTFCRSGGTGASWVAGMWQPSAGGLRGCIASPCRSNLGSGLPQQTWVGLDGLRAGVGHFGIGVWGEACPGFQPAAAGWGSRWQVA